MVTAPSAAAAAAAAEGITELVAAC
jgi:hypothetical protein